MCGVRGVGEGGLRDGRVGSTDVRGSGSWVCKQECEGAGPVQPSRVQTPSAITEGPGSPRPLISVQALVQGSGVQVVRLCKAPRPWGRLS